MIRIALTLLNIIRQVSQSPDTLRIGDEQFVMILAIISSIELAHNDFLVKIVAEIYVLLQAPKIISQPEPTLTQIMQELESEVGNGQVPAQMTPVQVSARAVKL